MFTKNLPRYKQAYINDPFTLSVEVKDPLNTTFQWSENGQPIQGETNSSLTVTPTQEDSIRYSVTATNSVTIETESDFCHVTITDHVDALLTGGFDSDPLAIASGISKGCIAL